MEQEEVVHVKVFDEEKGDVVFEGKVSTDVPPADLVKLRCFWERGLYGICIKGTNEQVKSFKGLQNNVELVAGDGYFKYFSGVMYVGADDGVLRKSKCVPLCGCVMMSLWEVSHEECDKAFECETLEELEISWCIKVRQIPCEIGKMKKLKKLSLEGLEELRSIPEEIGELSNLKVLKIGWCGIEGLPKRLKQLKLLKSISLAYLSDLQLSAKDLVVFTKLKHLTIRLCEKVFTPSFTQSFWEMIKSTTDVRVLELIWNEYKNQEMVDAALEENGSIADGGKESDDYAQFFNRNKDNHERARECALHLLAIRRWRDALNVFPKEMARMIAVMLWSTKCDANAWTKK